MRILQVGPLPPEAGGISAGGIPSHVLALSRSLTSRGHEVAVLADNVPYSDPWPRRVDGMAVFGTKDFRGPRRMRALMGEAGRAVPRLVRHFGRGWDARWVASKAAAFAAALRESAPEAVHVHAPEARFPFAAVLSRAPVVASVHSVHYVEFAEETRRELHRALLVRNLRLARDLVFVSRFVERQYEELFGVAMSGIRRHVIPNPADASLFRPLPRPEARQRLDLADGDRVLLFVGSLIPRKDPASLLRAAALLRDKGVGVRVLFVGEGPEEPGLRALAESLRIADSVRFDGVHRADELSAYYSAADLFVLPSLMESFGLVYVEAMLCGCPVVGTPQVLAEVVPGEAYGLKAAPGDPAGLADAIEAALAREWDRAALRAWGEGFDWRERIGAFESLYEGMRA